MRCLSTLLPSRERVGFGIGTLPPFFLFAILILPATRTPRSRASLLCEPPALYWTGGRTAFPFRTSQFPLRCPPYPASASYFPSTRNRSPPFATATPDESLCFFILPVKKNWVCDAVRQLPVETDYSYHHFSLTTRARPQYHRSPISCLASDFLDTSVGRDCVVFAF